MISDSPVLIPQSFFAHTVSSINTIDGLASVAEKMYIMYRKFCFVHVILITNQGALEKIPATIESVAFSFSVNCSFNNTFLF